MPLQLGSSGGMVPVWQRTMVKRFPSYALASDGTPLKDDGYIGNDDVVVINEYLTRIAR